MQQITKWIKWKLNILLCIGLIVFQSCQDTVVGSGDVVPGTSYAGKGYLFFFKDGMDGMGEFYFFPISEWKSAYVDTLNIFELKYKSGVAFHLPFLGEKYNKIKKYLKRIEVDTSSFKPVLCYTPINITILNSKLGAVHLPPAADKWSFELFKGNQKLTLTYFVTDEITIRQLDVPDTE